VHVFAPDGQRLWSNSLRDGPSSGRPAVVGDSMWFLTRQGSLQRHALADGSPLDRLDLNILPVGDLQVVGAHLVVPAGLGTLRILKYGVP
jgi:hypothetical protein